MNINDATLSFIQAHRLDDVRSLALRGSSDKSVDMPFALDQIAGWQMARKKLPTWAATDGIIFPPHLNMEQCSSEATAKYKSLAMAHPQGEGTHILIDLTGGFGVDFSFMSQRFDHAIYVERNKHLCAIAQHNFHALGLENVEVVCNDAIDYLSSLDRTTDILSSKEDGNLSAQRSKSKVQRTIYLDPARRDANGKKVFGIEDCQPDVLAIKDELLAKADNIIIKLSPMLDWHEAIRQLGDCVREVHIVSVGNECKELCLSLALPKGEGMPHTINTIKLFCINIIKNNDNHNVDYQKFIVDYSPSIHNKNNKQYNKQYNNKHSVSPVGNDGIGHPLPFGEGWGEALWGEALFLPNSSIMKAGVFDEVAEAYNVRMVSPNSHLFIGKDDIEDFPGRKFRIVGTTTMNKHELREKLKGITQANISVRNFPLQAEALRKRLKLKDGGDTYLFATTIGSKHIIIIAR